MSKLDRLIAELCPEGVEYKTLGEIGTVTRGNGLSKSDFTERGFPCIHYGQIYTYYGLFAMETKSFVSSELAIKLKKVSKGDIIIAVTSENIEDVCKCVAWLGDENIVTGGHTAIFKHNQNSKYITYYLQTSEFFEQKRKIAHGTKVIEVTPSKLEHLRIPLPPLPIQQEIVRILDKYTELTTKITAEITAEITARKKQYEYYRNELMTFDDDVPVVTLSHCCASIADGDHQAPQKADSGIPFITISNISNSNQIDFSNTKYVPETYYNRLDHKRKAQINDILYTVVGSFGIPVFIDSDKKFAFQRHIAILRPDCRNVLSKYLYHVLQGSDFLSQAHAAAVGAAQRTITLTALNRMKIPLPSLEEQARIISILDRFDTMTTDITSGLPAEIEARRKQYEYYRDKAISKVLFTPSNQC